jgi:hypothetical protein
MLITTTLITMLYLWVIIRAVSFFRLPGDARDNDKTIAAVIIAVCVMFIVARITTYVVEPWVVRGNSTSQALWIGGSLLNAMLYLAMLHQMIEHRRCHRDRRHHHRHHQSHPHGEPR